MQSLAYIKISSVLGFGVLGVALRFMLGEMTRRLYEGIFPFVTILINLIGSFLIGCVYVYCMEKGRVNEIIGLGLSVGFLGGFTTFSAFSLETVRLFESGHRSVALLYFCVSPILGVASASLGMRFMRHYA